MWLLILAIVILFMSAIQTAYYVECLVKKSYERPLFFLKHEMFLIYSNIILLVVGFTMLFIAVGWWGFAGIAIYWFLVLFVLMPIGMQRLLLLILREKQSTLPHGDRGETHLLHNLDRLEQKGKSEQAPDKEENEDEKDLFANIPTEDLLKLRDKHKSNKSVTKIIDDVLEARAKHTKA